MCRNFIDNTNIFDKNTAVNSIGKNNNSISSNTITEKGTFSKYFK